MTLRFGCETKTFITFYMSYTRLGKQLLGLGSLLSSGIFATRFLFICSFLTWPVTLLFCPLVLLLYLLIWENRTGPSCQLILDQDTCVLSSGTLWETLARPMLGVRFALSSLLPLLVLILLHAFKVMVFNAAYGLVGLQIPSFSVLWMIETGLTQIWKGC